MTLIVLSLVCIALCLVVLAGFIKSIYDDLDNNEF